MQHDKKIIEEALQLYTLEGKTIKEIYEKFKVPERTIYHWRNKYDWDNYIKAGGQIGIAINLQKQFIEELQIAIENKKLTEPKTADSLLKTSKILEQLMPRATSLSNIFNLFDSLVDFITGYLDDEEFIKMFQKYLPEMSDYVRKKFTS